MKSPDEKVSAGVERALPDEEPPPVIDVPPEPALPLLPEFKAGLKPDGDVSGVTAEDAEKAYESFVSGDYGTAARFFEKIAAVEPRAYLPLGFSYYKAGEKKKAQKALDEFLRHGEDFVARKLLAFIYYEENEIEKTVENAEKALKIRNDDELYELLRKSRREKEASAGSVREGTEHFTVIYDGYSHGRYGREAMGMLEDAYRSIGRDFGYFPKKSITVIFYTDEDFYAITRNPGWTRGLFDGKIRVPLRGAEEHGKELRKILFHEYTHALVHSLTERCPLWMNEGLAEYFSGGRKETGRTIPLHMLEKSFAGVDVNEAYGASYSAVKHLIEKNGLYGMKRFLDALSGGKDLNTAFREAFFVSYDEFVIRWGRD